MDTMEQEQDDLLATDWATASASSSDPLGAAWALIVAQRNMILAQSETIAGLERRRADAENRLGGALDTAMRENAAHTRLDAENRGLRGRVAAQHETIARLQRAAAPAVMAAGGDAPGDGPCACLQGGALDCPGDVPRRGRWIPWVRGGRGRWSR